MTILGSSRSITFSSSNPYSSEEGGAGTLGPASLACDAAGMPGCWRLGGRHARFLVEFCERYRLDALCACFLKLTAGGGAWLAFWRWVEEMAFCSSSRRVLSGMSSRSSSRNMSSSIFAVRRCRAHHHACWRAVVRVASSLTCQSTMVIMACIGADYLCRSAAHQSWTSESKPGSLGASQAPAKSPGRACPVARHRTAEKTDWKSSSHTTLARLAQPQRSHTQFPPSYPSLSKALFTLPTCARPARSLPPLTTTNFRGASLSDQRA